MANTYKTQTFESTAPVATQDMGLAVEDMKMTAKNRRRIFERHWYDNNFFDDGFHFRYLSRSSNKIVDLSERSTIYTPQRSIPKASRQIRGIMNLLMASDPTPTVYPEPIDPKIMRFASQPEQQPQVPGSQPSHPLEENPLYKQLVTKNREEAQKRGYWLLNEWTRGDGSGETIQDKVGQMVLLAQKHGVAYMQVWPDEVEEEIRTQVYDAFDIYLLGNYTSIYDCPFIIKSFPMTIAQIKANPLFDEDQLETITPDNKKASSEIKEAYMQSRFGKDTSSDQSASLVLNEAFIKEYITKDNLKRINAQEDSAIVMKDRHIGSPVIRHVFTAGGVWLYDHYTNLSEYPFVDFRMEAGPIYQVPMIERFMPTNKSLDSIISRVERYTHTMVTGAWLKRRGEQFKINNIAGGQVIEYDSVPPTQAQISPIPPFVYQFIELLEKFIEEQGVNTAMLGKLPSGITASAAIESLKEAEYANLAVPQRRLTSMMKRLARKFLEIADENYITPHDVSYPIKGDTISFQVIGRRALKERKRLKVEAPYEVISISKDAHIDIQIEQGMAYTQEGKRAVVQQIMNTMVELLKTQAIPVEALRVVAEKYLDSYQFGATQEFMDEIQKAVEQAPSLSEAQIMQMKIAILEALKEAKEIGPAGDHAKVMAASVGTLKALKETGIAGKLLAQPAKESVSLNYKDAPEDIKRQIEQKAGFIPNPASVSPVATDQMLKHAKLISDMSKGSKKEPGVVPKQ